MHLKRCKNFTANTMFKSLGISELSSGQKSELKQLIPPPTKQKIYQPMRMQKTCSNTITDSHVARISRQLKLTYHCHTYPTHWFTTPQYTHFITVTAAITLHVAVYRLPNTGMVSSISSTKYSYRIHATCLWRKSESIIKSNRYSTRYGSMAHCVASGVLNLYSTRSQV